MRSAAWTGVELRHLVALQAVASERSFNRAADRLGYTQSAISQQIAALERAVGVRLLERSGGPASVRPTEAGLLLLEHVEAITARIAAAQADLATFAGGTGRALRVGTYQSIGARILPPLLDRLAELHPELEVHLTESVADVELLGLVESGRVDLAFASPPRGDGPFEFEELFTDPFVLVAKRDSAAAKLPQPVAMATIATLPLVCFRSCQTTRQLLSSLRLRGAEPKVIFESDLNETVINVATSGRGVALVPRLATYGVEPDARVLTVDPKLPLRSVALVWHRDRAAIPGAEAFRRLAAEIGTRVAASAACEAAGS
ncbi:MAG: hypothetical protein QOE36_141 [Gaiellaceae bacterium]|nr:hypothetical protein [Gaiellaceae bacterium]